MTIETVNDRPLTVKVRRLLQEGQRRILLNLKGVPYLDTSGLCDIVEGYVATRRQGGCLKLLHPTCTRSNGAGHDAAVDDPGSATIPNRTAIASFEPVGVANPRTPLVRP